MLFTEFMNWISETPGIKAVLLPRNKSQEAQMKDQSPHWFTGSKVVIPKKAVDGLNLLWHSDLVVSGGGTMNREAAALGVPAVSIYAGKWAALDQELMEEGRLRRIESAEEIALLQVEKKANANPRAARSVRAEVVKLILE